MRVGRLEQSTDPAVNVIDARSDKTCIVVLCIAGQKEFFSINITRTKVTRIFR